ncbi:MAG TPA: hypothetical protein QF753_11115 [Victivallales bacterium]|nr:hypothetical protein [Victivallales bacterium]
MKRIDRYIKMETSHIAEKAILELQVNSCSDDTAIEKLQELHHALGDKKMNDSVLEKFKNEILELVKLSKGITTLSSKY